MPRVPVAINATPSAKFSLVDVTYKTAFWAVTSTFLALDTICLVLPLEHRGGRYSNGVWVALIYGLVDPGLSHAHWTPSWEPLQRPQGHK